MNHFSSCATNAEKPPRLTAEQSKVRAESDQPCVARVSEKNSPRIGGNAGGGHVAAMRRPAAHLMFFNEKETMVDQDGGEWPVPGCHGSMVWE